MKTIVSLVFFGFLIFGVQPTFAAPVEIIFKLKGQETKRILLSQASQMKGMAAKTIKVFEPHSEVQEEFVGVDFNEMMTSVHGKKWMDAEEVLFTCVDGYQPSIPVEQFKNHKAYLVYQRAALSGVAPEFTLINKLQAGEKVALGPAYLIWENIKDKAVRDDGAEGWPYQVAAIDLISFKDKFPKIAPPESASPFAKQGFAAFRKHCMACHSINGQGGGKAPELNVPRNVTTYTTPEILSRWILNPDSVRPGTVMPALNKNLKNREQISKSIAAYLAAVKNVR